MSDVNHAPVSYPPQFPTMGRLPNRPVKVQQNLLRQRSDEREYQNSLSLAAGSLPMGSPEPTWAVPIVILPPAPALPMLAPRRRPWRWCAAVLAMVLLLALAAQQDVFRGLAHKPPKPISLDSLALFDPGSAQLKASATKPLVNALAGIKAQPGWLIVIAGHTDSSGDAERNAQLSQARAAAVRDWMQRMADLPDGCFAIQGLAASQPLTRDDSEAGRATNRRVDIQLVPKAGACPGEAT